jgi:hypothetical protein
LGRDSKWTAYKTSHYATPAKCRTIFIFSAKRVLEDFTIDIRANMWYLHDGAPCHFAQVVQNWLNENFSGRWIERNRPVAWPARSPDLNPCDFLWGYMKDLVYSVPIDTIDVLREQVENAATTIRNNRGMLERVKGFFRRRLQFCIDNNGGQFEHFL